MTKVTKLRLLIYFMNYTILIAEDDDNIRKIIADCLHKENLSTIECENGKEALDLFDTNDVDLVILDVMMPKVDGFSVCRKIRRNSDVPIIILTARGDEDDELMGFELKADDYIKKPFSPSVLAARVKILLNRANSSTVSDAFTTIKSSGIIIDKQKRSVTIDNKSIELTPKEFDILCLLCQNPSVVFSRDHILNTVWGYDYFGDTRVVDTHVKKLRKAMGEKSFLIRTIFGVGYKYEEN